MVSSLWLQRCDWLTEARQIPYCRVGLRSSMTMSGAQCATITLTTVPLRWSAGASDTSSSNQKDTHTTVQVRITPCSLTMHIMYIGMCIYIYMIQWKWKYAETLKHVTHSGTCMDKIYSNNLIFLRSNRWLALLLLLYIYVYMYTLWLFKISGYIFVIAVLVFMSRYVGVSVLVCLYAMILLLCCL